MGDYAGDVVSSVRCFLAESYSKFSLMPRESNGCEWEFGIDLDKFPVHPEGGQSMPPSTWG